ncbi:MFS transporter [Rhodococcus sp. CSLK01-03]|uniref:MFS transporter n=1 Tax=Rhodococcus indonesiensis TaxID=3055869 RepID=A0ABT7RM64_9NOCA|nr:MFS transporter [Rhodococcus indonesiensis]MDM7488369.1 MFS transporter [Rhodococcus indonesiensis]
MTERTTAVAGSPADANSGRSRADSRRASRAAFVGTLLEYYDFSLYASAASVVFASVFFSGSSPLLATLQAVGTFAVGFLVRPVGGVILGSLGDRIGRKRILVFTLVLMGIATLLVGLLPGYDQIGWAAPALLVFLRILQGIGASGEYGGAALVAVEFSPEKKKGLMGSLPGMGAALGGVLGTLSLLTVSSLMSQESFLAWGWRIPFLCSVVILAYGLWLRRSLPETPAFREIEESNAVSKRPLFDVIRQQPRALLTVLVMTIGQTGIGYFYIVFMGTFGTNQLGFGGTEVLVGLIAAQLTNALLIPMFGSLSDRVGRAPVIMFGFLYSAVFAWVGISLLSGVGTPPLLYWVVMAAGNGIGVAAIFGPMGAYVIELFHTQHAYSGLGLGREAGNALGAAFVPVIAVALAFDDTTVYLSLLICVVSLLGFAATVLSRTRSTSPSEQNDNTAPVAV